MINSPHNQWVKHVVSLQQRKGRNEAREFVIEGWRFVAEALARGAHIRQVFLSAGSAPEPTPGSTRVPMSGVPLGSMSGSARGSLREGGAGLLARIRRAGIPIEEVDERVMAKMSATESPQGILAVVGQPQFTWADVNLGPDEVLLIIDGVQDPGNLGTILRTALAAGVRTVCCTKGTVDVYNPKVLRSTMGAVFSLVVLPDLSAEEILAFLHRHGFSLVVADVEGEPIFRQGVLKPPLALVVGNEGSGPSRLFKQEADSRVTIPMKQHVESLNAAMAAGIILYEVVRQRDFL